METYKEKTYDFADHYGGIGHISVEHRGETMTKKGKRTISGAAIFGVKGLARFVIYLIVLYAVLDICKSAYDFGYTVFYQEAVAERYGREITVEISEDASAAEIGKILEDAGLIRDHRVFVLQEFFSNYHGKLHGGTYVLSTAQTADEMISIMGSEKEKTPE